MIIIEGSLVSIIIPCYNNELFVEAAVRSALDQTYPLIEVIVIDDGSSDHSLEIVRSFGDLVRWESQSNQGGPAARNRGLQLANGDYVKFLDADDVLVSGCIERQMLLTREIGDNHRAIVYGEATWVDESLNPIDGYSLRARGVSENPIAHILTACPLTTCPLHKRDYLLEIGGFDVTLPRGQEHDLHLRLALAGIEFIYHPETVYKYRNYGGNARISNRALGSKGALMQHSILQRQQTLVEEKLGSSLPSAVRRAIAQRYWTFGRGVLREGHIETAKEYFRSARMLDQQHCITGNPPYPALARWLGPYSAEAILTHLKQLKLGFSG